MLDANQLEELVASAQAGDLGSCNTVAGFDDWHLLRRTAVGGSEVGAILGLNPYSRPIDVQQVKLGDKPDFEGNEATHWGKVLEGPIADDYQRRHGGPANCPLGGPYPTHRVEGRPWQIVTTDRLVLRVAQLPGAHLPEPGNIDRILEVKARGWYAAKGYGSDDTDQIPAADLCQGIWYMSGLGAERIDWAVLFNTHDYREFGTDRDPQLEADILGQVHDWWERHVVRREPVEPDGSASFKKHLATRFEKTSATWLIPDERNLADIEQLRHLTALRKHVVKAEELVAQRVQNALGEHIGFDLNPPHKKGLMYKHDARGRVNHSAVAEELARRLSMGPRAYSAVQETTRGARPRKMYTPHAWRKDTIEGDLAAVVNQLTEDDTNGETN